MATKTNSNEYRRADEELAEIAREMGAEYQTFSTRLRFDELNVPDVRRAVDAMYKRMNVRIMRRYRRLARRVYRDTQKEMGISVPGFGVAAFVLAMTRKYDPVTEYVYTREWKRKRDRLVEAIMSCTDRQVLRVALKRSLDVTYNQVRQYADDLTMQTRLEAFRDAGVGQVRWVTRHDERVCKICDERDGQIYDIDSIPSFHWRCRCWTVPVRK